MGQSLLRITMSSVLILFAPTGGADESADKNERLTIGVTQEFETLNPIIAQMTTSAYIYYMAGQPLVSIDDNWKWKCWLCTKVPSLENGMARIEKQDGGKKLRVDWVIRKDAQWGDGKPVTGHDVKLSWRIGKHENVSTASKDIYQRIEDITVDPEKPRHFTMTFRELRYDFAHLGTFYVVPKHVEGPIFEKTKKKAGLYEKKTRYATHPTDPALYNGAYKLDEIKLGSHVILKPNPHYGGTKPDIEAIVVKSIPDTQTLHANLLSGTIDMISHLGYRFNDAISFKKRLDKDPKLKDQFKMVFEKGMDYEHIDLNLRNPVLQDVRVRKALLYGIDRKKMVKALFEGRQEVARSMIHPKDVYAVEGLPGYEHDPKKARKLLKKAGWKKEDGKIRQRGGEKLSLTLMSTAKDRTRELVEVFIQEELRKVGVEIEIKNEPARTFFGETVRKGEYPAMAMFAWISSPDNPPRTTLHSDDIPTKENGYSGQNTGAWKNEEVDGILEQISQEFDVAKRKEMMTRVQRAYKKEVPVLPLYWRSHSAVIPSNLEGFSLTGHQFHSTLNVDEWRLTQTEKSTH